MVYINGISVFVETRVTIGERALIPDDTRGKTDLFPLYRSLTKERHKQNVA
jgi:hypothetical protein